MQQPPTYRIWIGVGGALGATTVAVVGTIYALSSALVDGSESSDVVAFVGVALMIGVVYGMIGGAVAGLVCAVVSRLLASRGVHGPAVQGVVAACVVASIATPTWVLMWPTNSWLEFVSSVALPLVVAVTVASFGGLLVSRLSAPGPSAST